MKVGKTALMQRIDIFLLEKSIKKYKIKWNYCITLCFSFWLSHGIIGNLVTP